MNLQRPWFVQIILLAESVTSEYPKNKGCVLQYMLQMRSL